MSAHRAARAPHVTARIRAFALVAGLAVVAPLLLGSPASAYWSVASSGTSLASAASVNTGSTPTATVANKNNVTVSWPATTLSNGVAVTGYTVSRYDASSVLQTTLAGCSGTRTTLSCTESVVPDGLWTYRVTPRIGDNWFGAQGAPSNQVLTDATAPVNDISLVSTPNAFLNNSTIWLRTLGTAGSFQLSNALSDATSGPVSSASARTGTSTGITHTAGTVSAPIGGPYISAPYSWVAGASSASGAARITGRDALGNTNVTSVPIRVDSTGPTGGAISYPSGQQSSTTITVNVAAIADSESGVARPFRLLQYRGVAANGASCGTFNEVWQDLLPDPGPSQSFTASLGCYQFRYVFTDSVGNQTITTPANNATVIIASASYGTTVLSTPGNISLWRLNDTTGTSIFDSGTAANNGQWFNGVALGQTGAIAASGNTSAFFDGSDDYGSVTRQIQDSFSIEFWFKSTQGLGGGQWWGGAGLVDSETAGAGNDFGVSLSATGQVLAGVGRGGAGDITLTSPGGKNDGLWHHVVFTRSAVTGALVLYIDGVQAATGTGATQPLNANVNVSFGRIQTGLNYYRGNLDEIAFYDVAISASTVLDHYNARTLTAP